MAELPLQTLCKCILLPVSVGTGRPGECVLAKEQLGIQARSSEIALDINHPQKRHSCHVHSSVETLASTYTKTLDC